MTYDLLIRGGCVIDGSGEPGRQEDVAVAGGKIVAMGRAIDGSARRIIDAGGLAVTPGFIDPHTHYDAQICWDQDITPSIWHGVTSVVMGNCGVGIAPARPQMREIAMRDLVNVEGIPFEILQQGITWDWESFPDYMDAAAKRGTALNLAFLAPLTPLRHYVMGEASMERAATPEETARIKALVKEAVTAGAVGFSTSNMHQHVGYQGKPLACRNASRDELVAYSQALRELGKGTIEIALCRDTSNISDEECALLDLLLTESGRPVTWLALLYRDDKPDACRDSLRKAASLIRRGALPQGSPLPLTRELRMDNPFIFAAFPSWKRVFNQTRQAQAEIFRDPAFRAAFRDDLTRITSRRWDRFAISMVARPDLKAFEGKAVSDVAREQGKDGVDAFLDLLLADDLETEFTVATLNVNAEKVPELLVNPDVLLALGDAGAHVSLTCDAGYCTYLLGHWVRERKVMSLEHAIHRLTAQPADLYGLQGRGRLRVGHAADIAIFDPATIGSAARGHKRHDLPGGAMRYVTPATGVHCTVVNGEVAYENGEVSPRRAGQVLRS